jgi:octaprenyl-diphosphate synthase
MQESSVTKTPIEQLSGALQTDMARVNAIILDRMQSDIPMIPEIAGYLIAAGGKRLRPLLTLACAQICGDKTDNPKKLAAAVEFIHTATLLHDDVVDGSTQRRGKAAANEVFGNQETVLVGDFLFARAFELMVETGNINALESLSRASRIITEGEVLQLSLIGETNITREQYFKVIEAKTAALFAAACEVAPILSGKDATAFYNYGHNLGMAFQIIDDVMDYTSPKMGKSKGDDFMEGKITLPVIIAMEQASDTDKEKLKELLKTSNNNYLNEFIDILNQYNTFEKSIAIAQNYSNKASANLAEYGDDIATDLIELPQSILGRVV